MLTRTQHHHLGAPYPQASSDTNEPLFVFDPEDSTPDLVQAQYRVIMCGKGPDACLAPRPTKENGMDAAAAANLASKNAVIVCDAAFGRLHFKEGERGDAVLYEPLMLSSKGGAELQVDVTDKPKGAKDNKGDTQMRDTCIASAKHDDTRARFLISKYNGYERAKHARTAIMGLDVLTYGLSDAHNKPTVQRQFNIELGAGPRGRRAGVRGARHPRPRARHLCRPHLLRSS